MGNDTSRSCRAVQAGREGMGLRHVIAAFLLTAVTLAATGAAAQPVRLQLDQETEVNGVPVACTGVGQTKSDPKWLAYPVRLEFAQTGGAYVADETVEIMTASGAAVVSLDCEGPWILLKLPPA